MDGKIQNATSPSPEMMKALNDSLNSTPKSNRSQSRCDAEQPDYGSPSLAEQRAKEISEQKLSNSIKRLSASIREVAKLTDHPEAAVAVSAGLAAQRAREISDSLKPDAIAANLKALVQQFVDHRVTQVIPFVQRDYLTPETSAQLIEAEMFVRTIFSKATNEINQAFEKLGKAIAAESQKQLIMILLERSLTK